VLNDFEAIGYGVPVVPEEDLVVLHDAPVSPKVTPSISIRTGHYTMPRHSLHHCAKTLLLILSSADRTPAQRCSLRRRCWARARGWARPSSSTRKASTATGDARHEAASTLTLRVAMRWHAS